MGAVSKYTQMKSDLQEKKVVKKKKKVENDDEDELGTAAVDEKGETTVND